MNDVSKLSGASPVSPTSNRVWKPPKKQKPGGRPARKDPGKHRREEEENREERKDLRTLQIEEADTQGENGEPLSYGAGGLKKPRNHKVDLII